MSLRLGLSPGIQTSITAPLSAALSALSSNNPNSVATACNQLAAFINQVNARVHNGQLTTSQGSQLIQSAEAIQKALGC